MFLPMALPMALPNLVLVYSVNIIFLDWGPDGILIPGAGLHSATALINVVTLLTGLITYHDEFRTVISCGRG